MVPTHNTTCLSSSIGADMLNDPTSVILLMPTDDDCTGVMVDDVDPVFNNSPTLSDLVNRKRRFDERNTLTQRKYPGGGSLKVLAARAPRNLRRHRARKLYCDEVDGMEITKEGDPVALAENRTESFPDRKIIIGSTPKDAATSFVLMRWKESDQRVFEVPCPQCEEQFELLWEHIRWTPRQPSTVHAVCPKNGCIIEERHKVRMVEAGEWRAMKPDVVDHAGFRINALVSLQPNAKWANQVRKYEKAKRAGPSLLQPFYNTVLGQAWETTLDKVSDEELLSRVENFGLKRIDGDVAWDSVIPEPVRYITHGVDVQGDRLECQLIGWSETQRFVLGHEVIRGATTLESTWDELLALIQTRWKHPLGGEIGIEATAIDSGDGNRTQQVYNFCTRHADKRVFAIKGAGGPRPVIKISSNSRQKRHTSSQTRPWIVGVDIVKADILTSVNQEKGAPGTFRFSHHLDEEWFRQFSAEQKVIEYVKGRPVAKFVRIEGRQAEALDCAVYGIAVRNLCRFDFKARERELSVKPAVVKGSLKTALAKLHG
jgi:phage terminase large subunit GpA-like protein